MADWNWNTFLDKAITGTASKVELEEARAKAKSWVTCAVGESCKVLPRHSDGAPKDRMLLHFGLLFNDEVYRRDFADAKVTLNNIEDRVSYLLKQYGSGGWQNG